MDWFHAVSTSLAPAPEEAVPTPAPAPAPVEPLPVARVEASSLCEDEGCPQAATAHVCVTAPVTPYVEPELPTSECIDGLDIPPFLRRRVGGWVYPSLHNPSGTALQIASAAPLPPGDQRTPQARSARELNDAELAAVMNADLSVSDRQPFLRELHRREDTKKARDRIAKMKESLGDRHANPVRSNAPVVRRVRNKRH